METNISSNNFLSIELNKMLSYFTPKEIIDFIKLEQTKYVIGNPPFCKTIKTSFEEV